MLKKIQWQHPLFYVPLVFIAFPVLGIFYFDYPQWTIGLTSLFIFSYLYLIHMPQTWLTNILWTVMIGYIFYMTIYVNGGMMWFIFYLANLLTFNFGDKLRSYRFLSYLVLILAVMTMGVIYGSNMGSRLMAILLPIICLSMQFYWTKDLEVERQQKELVEKNRSINLLLAENERNRIGQDLHDTLGHVFAMLTIKAELTQALLENEDVGAAQQEVTDLQSISKKAMGDVRAMVQSLKRHSLAEEIMILDNMLELAGVELTVTGQEIAERLADTVQGTLPMVLRELATNLIKHSQASNCSLQFEQVGATLVIHYKDDGCGFKEQKPSDLHTIKERLVIIQGQLEMVSLKAPTQIRIMVPFKEESK